ncbi:hypothetical protein EVAR_44880_1 [Eumeta japonica]|uniref:Uncharacterized protein n=1 Tax=Eumeta variegata TaxID=151549 RepID=A0A4C1Y4T6_EUMVA|nr:hypothetical protein EVAR_44880_1 [Eumeta japonica]
MSEKRTKGLSALRLPEGQVMLEVWEIQPGRSTTADLEKRNSILVDEYRHLVPIEIETIRRLSRGPQSHCDLEEPNITPECSVRRTARFGWRNLIKAGFISAQGVLGVFGAVDRVVHSQGSNLGQLIRKERANNPAAGCLGYTDSRWMSANRSHSDRDWDHG